MTSIKAVPGAITTLGRRNHPLNHIPLTLTGLAIGTLPDTRCRSA